MVELILIVTAFLTQWNCVLGSPIQSVSVAGRQRIEINLCEPVYVILDVVISPNASPERISEIPNALAADVRIDDENFHLEFNSIPVNPVASFGMIRRSVEMNAGGIRRCKVVAMMLWNFATDAYVFQDPGTYRVTFFDQASIDVTVIQPTADEAELIKRLQDMGIDFPLFLSSSRDRKRRDRIAPKIQALVEEFPNTAHAPLLNIRLGLVKLSASPSDSGSPDFDLSKYWATRGAMVKKYLEPYCDGELTSLWTSTAAYQVATVSLDRVRYDKSMTPADRIAVQEKAIELLRKVAKSPYSFSYGVQADARLRELDRSEGP